MKKTAKRAFQIRTVNQALNLLDVFLAKKNRASAELWNILAGTRGPDSNDRAVKVATTTAIRRAAFPKTAGSEGLVSFPASFAGKFNSNAHDIHFHFNAHVQSAIEALQKHGRVVS